ncbi:hypothetical protein HWQ46_25350 [Shewanella sp. D64]|uniref:hypothetical protein n=1 Tax=unclassified Shewanella TaxID=196818 RepID=UPI0022BA6192|nr:MULTISPECIES: hypothetical protein [unclassified Shewanella]MEC4728845.1 hypothetical protein [Shewanella sp. D64]MEC4740719.1 hypothetical protein [Shewanella sp. E94]WBJ95322.1 hypothetical protein HWQ47_26635 [Shewanella sp. MTB7]
MEHFAYRLQESSALILMFVLACAAGLLKDSQHSFKSICSGVALAGFVAYAVNLLLIDYGVSENIRVVTVGAAAYLNRYIVDMLDKLATQLTNDPKQFLESLKRIWKK